MMKSYKKVLTIMLVMYLVSQCEGVPPFTNDELSSPDTLLYVALVAKSTSIDVSWAVQAPADPAGEYRVTWVDQHGHHGNAYVADEAKTTIRGLKPCTRYTVSVTRVHSTGQLTTDSVEKSIVTGTKAPPAVNGLLSRDITARSLSLSWERPTTECEVTAYRIIYEGVAKWPPYSKHKNNGGISKGAADNATEFKVDNLHPYSNYFMTVVAYTSGGKGRSANLTFITKEDVPEKPVGLLAEEITATSITATWVKPAVTNGVLGPYYINWYHDGKRMGIEREGLTSYTITGLSPCTEYTIHVEASTAAGTGDYKKITQITDTAAPTAVAKILCHLNEDQSVTMSWTKPDTACNITGYKVLWSKDSFHDDIDTVNVKPSVLSANFSIQTGTEFRACVTGVVSETLIGSQACCDQETITALTVRPHTSPYYVISTYTLAAMVVILLLTLLVTCSKLIQQEDDRKNQGSDQNSESSTENVNSKVFPDQLLKGADSDESMHTEINMNEQNSERQHKETQNENGKSLPNEYDTNTQSTIAQPQSQSNGSSPTNSYFSHLFYFFFPHRGS